MEGEKGGKDFTIRRRLPLWDLYSIPMLVIKTISEYLTFLGARSPKGDIGDNLDNIVKKLYRPFAGIRYTVAGKSIESERRKKKKMRKEREV